MKVFSDRTALSNLDFSAINIYSPYRRGVGLSKSEQRAIFQGELAEACDLGGAVFVLFGEVEVAKALLVVKPLVKDSEHFSMPMAKLMLSAAPGCDSKGLASFVSDCLSRQEVQHYKHLAADIDIDDYACLNALLSRGFSLLDTKRTYYATRLREDINVVRQRQCVRPYMPSDYRRVMEIVAQTDFSSRFSRDVALPQDKVKSFKEKWFSQLLEKSDAERLALVFERSGRVEACGVIDTEDFTRYGVPKKIMQGGLYATSALGVGGYIPVLHRLTLEAISRHGAVGTTVSLNNVTPMRVLESFRSYSGSVIRYSLCRYVGHTGPFSNVE